MSPVPSFDDFFQQLMGDKSLDGMENLLCKMLASNLLSFFKETHSRMGTIISDLEKQISLGNIDPRFNPFEVLGVSVDATQEEVKAAYVKKSKQHHPDKGGMNEEMTKVNLAYELICRVKGWQK